MHDFTVGEAHPVLSSNYFLMSKHYSVFNGYPIWDNVSWKNSCSLNSSLVDFLTEITVDTC